MFDGFKSEHGYLLPDVWKSNPRLPFSLNVYEETGEAVDDRRTANYRGLVFRIVPSIVNPIGHICSLGGSLHKYFNDGIHNANDFSLSEIRDTLAILESEFGIQLDAAPLRGLEFGVNIKPPIPVDQVLSSIISHNEKPFGRMSMIGIICQRSDYHIKMYDKYKQSGRGPKDRLRVEIKVVKMRYLRARYGIETLSDLGNWDKISPLGDHLASVFGDVIFHEVGIDESRLTKRQILKLESWKNPLYWQGLSRRERSRERGRYEQIISESSETNTKKELQIIINEKWKYLLGAQHQKCPRFHRLEEEIAALKVSTISPFKCRVKSSHEGGREPIGNTNKKNADFSGQKYAQARATRIQSRECISCGRSISHQRKGSRFCSEKYRGKAAKVCRNIDSGRRRTMRQRASKSQAKNQVVRIGYWEDEGLKIQAVNLEGIEIGSVPFDHLEQLEIIKEDQADCINGDSVAHLFTIISQKAGKRPKP